MPRFSSLTGSEWNSAGLPLELYCWEYHYYLGDPVEILQLYPDGRSERVILGQDVLHGQQVQYVAPREVWMGSHLLPGGKFALIGTTMAPGFTNDDYVGGERAALIQQY